MSSGGISRRRLGWNQFRGASGLDGVSLWLSSPDFPNQKQVHSVVSIRAVMGRKPKARGDSDGAWLHHLPTERGLSQDELAAKVRIPQSTLAYWERTGKLPGREVILRLSEELGISVSTLLRAGK
jgi:hypothetical protein